MGWGIMSGFSSLFDLVEAHAYVDAEHYFVAMMGLAVSASGFLAHSLPQPRVNTNPVTAPTFEKAREGARRCATGAASTRVLTSI